MERKIKIKPTGLGSEKLSCDDSDVFKEPKSQLKLLYYNIICPAKYILRTEQMAQWLKCVLLEGLNLIPGIQVPANNCL